MKTLILVLCFSFGHANPQVAPPKPPPENSLDSPFPSTIKNSFGIDIPNSHLVSHGPGTILRGEQPKQKGGELSKAGVTEIVIFKNQIQDEIDQEEAALQPFKYFDVDKLPAGQPLPKKQIKVIPFHYHQFPSLSGACSETIQALKRLYDAYQTPGKILFLHCTVGEDRTGYLAGLFRMLVEHLNAREAWDGEMCKNGYGSANPCKPPFVDDAINQDLTPLFLKMATLIESGTINTSNLADDSVCAGVETIVPKDNPATWPACPALPLPAGVSCSGT